jgi:2-isopropylmalate synthase
VEECTGIPVHARHPYGGDLVFTAFSGTHQDAIRKGLDARQTLSASRTDNLTPWRVPYVPVDPADLGGSHDGLIRVTSQSGKAGTAHVLRSVSGLHPPTELQREFSAVVQAATEQRGELSPALLWRAFRDRYFFDDASNHVESWTVCADGSDRARMRLDDTIVTAQVSRTDPTGSAVELLSRATGEDVTVIESAHQADGVAGDLAAYFTKVAIDERTAWGAAVSEDSARSAFVAVLAARRSLQRAGLDVAATPIT